MTAIGDGFKNIFLAGIGAMAITGEKSKELVDQLVAKGELTVDQGKQINSELQHKANEATQGVRDGALEARMAAMSPEERERFAAKAAEIAADQNARDAAKADKDDGTVEVEVDSVEDGDAAEAPTEGEAAASAPQA